MTTPVHPVLGRALAYAGQRAHDRKTTTGAVAHAVWELVAGYGREQPDAECGKLGYIPLGAWDPDYPHNCPECAAVLAGGELPEVPHEPEPALEPAPGEPPVPEPALLLVRSALGRPPVVITTAQTDLFGAA